MNVIESIRVDSDLRWKILPINEKIEGMHRVAGVEWRGKVVIFGGSIFSGRRMYVISQEGEFEQDLSADPLIPK